MSSQGSYFKYSLEGIGIIFVMSASIITLQTKVFIWVVDIHFFCNATCSLVFHFVWDSNLKSLFIKMLVCLSVNRNPRR